MESVKDRMRLALALLVTEHCSTSEQLSFALTGLRAQVLGQREARQALAQCIDDSATASATDYSNVENIISQLKSDLFEARSQHARQLEQRDLEIHSLRAQLDLGSSTASTSSAPLQPPIDAAAAIPSFKPKTKKSLAREAAISAFEQSLRPDASTSTSTAEQAAGVAASDLRSSYSIIDAIASYRAAVKSAVMAVHQLDRVSLLSRAATRLIGAVSRLLELYTSPTSPSPTRSDVSGTEQIRQNVAEVFPMLVDVLRWCISTTGDFAQWASKLARQQRNEPSPGIETACEALLNAVSSEISRLTQQCITKIVSHSVALQDTLDFTFTEQPSSKAKLKTQTAALQLMLDADVRYRLLDLLNGMLVMQPSQSTLQCRLAAQSLLLSLKSTRELCCLPSDASSDQSQLCLVQPRRDALVLLLPLATNLAARMPRHQSTEPITTAAVKEAHDTLSDMVTNPEALQTLEEQFGGIIKEQLLKLLEELLLAHSVTDYTRLLNLAPMPIMSNQWI